MPAEVPGQQSGQPSGQPSRRQYGSGVSWGFGVLAGVIAIILLSWGFGGNGHGWGHDQMAHMMPAGSGPASGPASRAWSPPPR